MKEMTILVALWSCIITTLHCQNSESPNIYVREAYTDSHISMMSSERIRYLNFLSVNAWEIVSIPAEKQPAAEAMPLMYRIDHITKTTTNSYLSCSELNSFNLLKYNFAVKKERSYYKIFGCAKWLMIKSHAEITREFNEFRNKQNSFR